MARTFYAAQIEINETLLKIVKNLGNRLAKLEKKGSKHVTK